MEDVLIHAIVIASKDKDKNGIIMCILFYLKNKYKMDLLEIKKIARKLEINNIWIDIENFLRYNPITNTELLPKREEFKEKAELYDIPKELYELPNAYPVLFEELSRNIITDVNLYIIGGENMRIKGLKQRTKDCDIILDNEQALQSIITALEKMGYVSKNEKSLSKDDSRVGPFKKFSHSNRSDIEIFYNDVLRKLYLSNRMKQRAEAKEIFSHDHNKLKIYLLANEDIFLLKAVTDREGDLYDMAKLVQAGNFDWNIVWNELEEQEKDTSYHFSNIILNSIDDFIEQTNIKPPFYKKLIHKTIDENICKLVVKNKGVYLDDLVSILKGHDISEKMIRNRIDSLNKKESNTKI